jgi:acyl-CoA thioesterase II
MATNRVVTSGMSASLAGGRDPSVSFRAVGGPEASPCALPARAWWGDHLVASSRGAVRVDQEGEAPTLWFPAADVRFERGWADGGQRDTPVGTAETWSIDGTTGLLCVLTEPTPGCEALAGRVAFDHDRARVELVDGATVKRFPTWGDATDLIDLLDVRPAGDGGYVSVARADWRRPVTDGSQMLAQALVAASRHTAGRRAVSAHMVFMRAADARRPLRFDLQELSAGRTFTTLAAHVSQEERGCAHGTLLLDATAPDVIRHAVDPPDVAGPDDSEPYDMSVTGRDLRIVDGVYTGDPDAPAGPPVLDAWVRFRDVPDDPALHAALLAQFTGHLSIAAGLRPHEGIGQRQAHRTLSTAINAIALSLHADVRADRWMLYRHRSSFAGDGMTHAECRVHDEDGALLASFTVDAMVRRFAGSGTAADDRTAL